MLGSAKLSRLGGHIAFLGDRFSLVQAARASIEKKAKALYYPKYNPTRPPKYNLKDLPQRSQAHYWKVIELLNLAKTKTARATISRDSGIVALPACAASPAFLHPSYFPLDPFHLFYENITPFLWDLWTVDSTPGESVHVPSPKIAHFGVLVAEAMRTLPPAFCGPRQSQYKAYKWMALFHWYILPIGLELEFPPALLRNFSYLVEAVEIAMTVQSHSISDLQSLEDLIVDFLLQYEHLYVGDDPEKVQRCRLCIFQLIHVPIHIMWYGSIRLSSQATVERSIGEVGRKITSRKEPFAHLSNIIVEQEIIRVLSLYYPELTHKGTTTTNTTRSDTRQKIRISKSENLSEELAHHLSAIFRDVFAGGKGERWSSKPADEYFDDCHIVRFGKRKLANGMVLRSEISEKYSTGRSAQDARDYRWFEGRNSEGKTSGTLQLTNQHKQMFGEVISFYAITNADNETVEVAVYRPLVDVCQPLKTVIQGRWPSASAKVKIAAVEVESICTVVGIWAAPQSENIYILRKHPGLLMLTPLERGIQEDTERDEMDD
ncbi:hypothetical protein FA13DRAFT_1757772 [Coprinellus micaceus]|uniref:Uncharacterized protein n=1 Tax=Coprinellus micaceus TaxID=71717 RepID=A0A4Y7SF97_COPMI|nr:hypothetical protein FA13DRAFT_1757772 [Coprinellus micaceus]